MEASEFEEQAFSYLKGSCSDSQRRAMEAFLKEQPQRREELEELGRIWQLVKELPEPEPSPEADSRFQSMLSDRIEREASHTLEINPGRKWNGRTAVPNWFLAACLLIGGFLLGRYFIPVPGDVEDNDAVTLQEYQQETSVPKDSGQETVLTLLEEPIAAERLKGINRVENMSQADEQVINALLQTLITDTNVNVRLAAIEALSNYTEIPMVREGLVAAIRHQDAPLVQISLAELMVRIQEKRSVSHIKTIIAQEQTDSIVKKALSESIRQII